ncbi:MAG: hypothetical protein ABIT05_01200 [Chitinophagaceae bacterium]
MQNKDKIRVTDAGPWLVDNKLLGTLDHSTEGIVMDNVHDRDKMKLRVKIMRTSSIALLQGNSTVAIFRIKKKDTELVEPQGHNVTNLFTSYLNKKAAKVNSGSQ